MPRPAAKPALPPAAGLGLVKAPVKDHPAAPSIEPVVLPATAPAPEPQQALRMYSARIDSGLARRTKLYAVRTGRSLQQVTEAALIEYIDNHPPTDNM